jgi:hypothetical protein
MFIVSFWLACSANLKQADIAGSFDRLMSEEKTVRAKDGRRSVRHVGESCLGASLFAVPLQTENPYSCSLQQQRKGNASAGFKN